MDGQKVCLTTLLSHFFVALLNSKQFLHQYNFYLKYNALQKNAAKYKQIAIIL